MRKTSSFVVSFLALGLLALSSAVPAPAAAQDCPRSFLDDRYCDRDGNLTADLPLDPAEWVEPDTLIFSYTPVEDPSVYRSEEHTSELQSLMRISYAVFCLKKKNNNT